MECPEEFLHVWAARYLRIPYDQFERRDDKAYLVRLAVGCQSAENEHRNHQAAKARMREE